MSLENLYYYRPVTPSSSPRVVDADLCIYGGTSAGVAAALQAKRMGLKVVIAEFGRHLGGLSASGLGATDIGNKAAIGGISRSFYRTLGQVYPDHPTRDVDGSVWTFEPHAAETIFNDWVGENDIPVYFEQHLARVETSSGRIVEIAMEDNTVYRARAYIDATYEGDLMAMAGVSYHVGRESNAVYKETINGIHFGSPHHMFYAWVDPYVVPGKPDSGLIWGVQDAEPGYQGQGDSSVQAYNFRICLTNVPENRVPFPEPPGYDPDQFTLMARYLAAGVWDAMRLHKMMPRGKTDLNNKGAVSTDMIGMNHEWPEASYKRREELFQEHFRYNLGLLYFLSNDDRVPDHVREEVRQWGLTKDEFQSTGGWPHALYVREGRRMKSDVVMTENHCRKYVKAEDPVGLAAYTMDSHNCRRIVIDGRAVNEGNVEVPPTSPYGISYRSIVPKGEECTNLLVPVALSSSHIAFGSIRMEPVFMVLGQSAATAAAIALDRACAVQDVPYPALKERLLADGQVLDWAD